MSAIDWQRVKRVLVTMLRHHGDVLLTSPVFSVLQNRFPHLEIDALVYGDTAPMLRNHPAIAQIHCIDRRWRNEGLLRQGRAIAGLLRRMKQRRYELTLHPTTHWFGAWMNRVLRPRYAVVADFQKAKRSGRLWRGSFTHFYPYRAGAHRHMVEKHLDALRFLGIEPGAEESRLVLRPGEAAYAKARRLLAEAGLEEGRFAAVHPASRWLFKCWKEEAVAQVLDHLATAGCPAVLTAAPDQGEVEMTQRIAAACKVARPASFAGRLELEELAAVIDLARLQLGVDSAPMHIAAAMQTPCVALFGPSEPSEWGPWKAPHRVISSRDFPRPAGEVVTDPLYRHSLDYVPVQAVVRAVDEMLTFETENP